MGTLTENEERKNLLKKLSEWFKEWTEKIKEKIKGHHAPSVYEAIKSCEEALDELGEAQDISTHVLKNLVDITSDLENRMQFLTAEQIENGEVEKAINRLRKALNDAKKSIEHSVVKVTNEDITEALKDCFCGSTAKGTAQLNENKQVFLSPDNNEVYIKVGDKYAEVFLIKSDNEDEKDEVYIKKAELTKDKRELLNKLVSAEIKENDTIEDTLLRAICTVNDVMYKNDIVKKEKIEKQVESGNLLMSVVKNFDTAYQSSDGKTECAFMKSDNSFRVRDKSTNNMLMFVQKEGALEVSICRNTSSFNDVSKKLAVGKWENIKNGGIEGHITDFDDNAVTKLMQSEFSSAYLTYVVGLSDTKLQDSFGKTEKEVISKVSDKGMDKIDEMYKAIKNVINSKEGFHVKSINNHRHNDVSLSIITPNDNCYYINFTKDGEIKNHKFKYKDSSIETVSLSGNKIINADIAQDNDFKECSDIIKQAEILIEKSTKAQEKPEKQKGIEKE